MGQERTVKCEICGGGGYLVHKGVRDNKTIDVYRCPECGTKFLSDTQERNYANGYMYETSKMASNVIHLSVEERLDVFRRDDERRYHMLKNLCKGKTVLDFGCGFGGFLNYIKETAAECAGIEQGKEELDYLNNNGVRCADSIEKDGRKYDVITLFNVFEHLADPRMWLKKFHQYLNTGGKLILEIPNADDALLELYHCSAFADFTYWSAHLFLYTTKSIEMLIREIGKYNVLSMGWVQRYPISNHLMWLAKGLPRGHEEWGFMDSEALDKAYKDKLEKLGMCDSLFIILEAV